MRGSELFRSQTLQGAFAQHAKVSFIVTAAVSTVFFQGQLAYFVDRGWDVEFISGPGSKLDALRTEGAKTTAIPMRREIAPLKDLVSLWRLWRHFRRTRPDLVVSGTPKAGLLGTLAARLAGVPHVVYTMHGLRLETATGWKRGMLWAGEWLACHAAHSVRAVSSSLRTRVLSLGLTEPERCSVIGAGTSNGVDTDRWRRTPQAEGVGRQSRERLGIAPTARLLGFVGRFTRDKGIAELYEAFKRVQPAYPDLRLLMVGDFETGDPVSPALRARIEADPAVIRTGFISAVAEYYWAMDVLALPTYREGFPGVPLEAQAASVPVVTTDATGAIDAIVDGVTGIRVPVGDVDALTVAFGQLLGDSELRARMGRSGRKWVEQNFKRETVWRNLMDNYGSMLQSPSRCGQGGLGKLIKLTLDRLAAALVLILSVPMWLAAAIAIRLTMGAPVLFRQVRPGYKGRPFTLFKFRTMRDARDSHGTPLSDADRLTGLGRLLRSTSIDELPQLWNVLRGEMSLVGPRPLLMKYLDRYTPEQARRHEIKPGITGWAQVNGRNGLCWEEKFALDLWYVDHRSFRLDCKILWLTLLKVVKRDGISQSGHATMPEFMGLRKEQRANQKKTCFEQVHGRKVQVMSMKLTVKRPSDFVPFLSTDVSQGIHQRIEKQVRLYPDHVALKTPEGSLSYAEMNARANSVAEEILAVTDSRLGQAAILLPNTPDMIVSLLAAMKAHKAYVPLDPKLPPDRMHMILGDVEPSVLISDDLHLPLAESLSCGRIPVVNVSSVRYSIDASDPNVPCDPMDRAYILYTSGTTGIPKGITFLHRNLVHHIACMTNNLFYAPSDRVTWLHSASFSASVVDIYSCLMNGGSLFPWDVKKQGFIGMADWLVASRVTTLQWIPSAFRQFLRTVPDDFVFQDMRLVVMASESLTVREVDLFRRHFPVGSHLVNQVGTSESYNYRLYAIDHAIPVENANIQAGYSVSDDREVLILNEQHHVLPVGSIGEIGVRSAYMSSGYWRNEELTRSRFITLTDDKTPVYLTGDMGMLEVDGCLIHLGRSDSQVKVRGFRVELAEIDQALSKCSGVADSITRVVKNNAGESQLVSYILSDEKNAFNQKCIEEQLTSKLPEYMVPTHYKTLSSFPLLPNGKIDYQKLPNPFSAKPAIVGFEETRTHSLLQDSISLFTEALGIAHANEHTSFLEEGGDSLSLAVLMHLVHLKFGVAIDAERFLSSPTPLFLSNLVAKESDANYANDMYTGSPIWTVEGADARPASAPRRPDRLLRASSSAPSIHCGRKKKLIIIGAGGLGRETYTWAIQAIAAGSPWIVKGFLDKRSDALEGWQSGVQVLADISDYSIEPDDVFIGAVGDPKMKIECYAPIIEKGGTFVNVIHPLANIGVHVQMGVGIVAGPFASITCDAAVGDHVSIGALSNLGHDTVVGDWCHISSHCGVNGMVRLGNGVFLGSHACIIPGISIGDWSYVGAGSLVLRDVQDEIKVFGNPASVIGRSYPSPTKDRILRFTRDESAFVSSTEHL